MNVLKIFHQLVCKNGQIRLLRVYTVCQTFYAINALKKKKRKEKIGKKKMYSVYICRSMVEVCFMRLQVRKKYLEVAKQLKPASGSRGPGFESC